MRNTILKKLMILLLCAMLLTGAMVSCKGNNENPDDTTKPVETVEATLIDMEPLNPATDLEFYVDANFESSISLSVPGALANKYHTKVANSFSEGWFELTVCLGGENMSPEYKLFTIYGYKYPEHKDYTAEKNFSEAGCDGVYTYVWFEYDHSDVKDEKIKEEITFFEKQYETIKESIRAVYEPKEQTNASQP